MCPRAIGNHATGFPSSVRSITVSWTPQLPAAATNRYPCDNRLNVATALGNLKPLVGQGVPYVNLALIRATDNPPSVWAKLDAPHGVSVCAERGNLRPLSASNMRAV